MGTMARRLPYNFEMGLRRGTEDKPRMPGTTFDYRLSEESGRARFSRWLAFMEAKSWDDLYPIKKDADHNIWRL